MKKLIVANWKMNPSTFGEAKKLFQSVKSGLKKIRNSQIIICPPFVYLPLLKGIKLGAQDVFWKNKGAFTGEISPFQLKDLKVEYVILGHSERRINFGESDQIIGNKLKEATLAGLKSILCVGETDQERKEEKISEILEKQIKTALKNISRENIENIIIAYEPVWAIGTGKECSVEQTMSCVLLIKKIISQIYNRQIADNLKVLYGGSVSAKNANLYVYKALASGLMVGGASLNAEEFLAIAGSL